MRLHDRYLFRELLTPLAFCLVGFLVFCFAFLIFNQMGTIQEQQLSLWDVMAYCAVSLPGILVQLLPILLLLSMLYALTLHARHNELTALRAAGVSLMRLCAPYFAVGLLATGTYFALNEFAVPYCNQQVEQILGGHLKKEAAAKGIPQGTKGFFNARSHRYWQFADYDEQTTRMQNVTVKWAASSGAVRVLRAEAAARTNGVWTFFNAQTFMASEQSQTTLTNILAMPEFDETPDQVRLLLKFSNKQTLHGSVNADIPLAELWEFMRNNPGLNASDSHAWETKFHERLAMPWTCLVVVLVAIPFGAQSGRRNLFFGVAGSIFIGFLYFVIQRVSLAFGMNGQLPGWLAAWLPNLVFAIGGLLLTLRVR
jgi:lipopolysaccharide export system permease protein